MHQLLSVFACSLARSACSAPFSCINTHSLYNTHPDMTIVALRVRFYEHNTQSLWKNGIHILVEHRSYAHSLTHCQRIRAEQSRCCCCCLLLACHIGHGLINTSIHTDNTQTVCMLGETERHKETTQSQSIIPHTVHANKK